MGFEGHVFDMIQRTKQNRKMIQDRRDRMNYLIERMHEKSLSDYPEEVSEEELEQIKSDIAGREHDEKMYYFRFTVYFLGILFLVLLVGWVAWKLM